ncbi:DNA repair protein complementing XP-C cells homolog [Homarus americanus]|uniref:DNA repair protein complementing XP-C cells homolog n=1 Tax=Homarus americanus TaxID=6706 RepID=UPI001C469A4C|nr:DNA repair protein complementing XP-C cells homolog [Homarus americanus]
MHKAHLLCLFAHGRHVNMTLNSDTLLAAALSIITDKNAYPPKRLDLKYLEKFVNWFSKKIAVKPEDMEEDYWSHSQKDILVKRFETKQVCSNREFVIMFVIMCRALGMNVRLVLSLQPMSWKPSAERLIKPPKKTEKKPNIFSEPSCSQTPESTLNKKNNKEEKDKLSRKMLSSDSDVDVKGKRGSKIKNSKGKEKKIKKRKSLSGGDDDDDDDSDFDLTPVKLKRGPQSVSTQRQRSDKRKSSEGSGSTDKRKENENDGKVEGKRKKNEPLMEWAEVYVEEEEKWVCVDVTRRKIHCTAEIGARMPATSAYITAYNANLTVKDVSKRYVPSWLSNENKLRCCSKWWEKVLRSFKGQRTRLDKEEDKEMDLNLKEQPLPKSIGEYKNHPLYALQRHLLKFEAIYPPDVSPVGFIRSEPVYPRDSIYNLHSRDTWMKEAKTVIVGEEPYKVVKARPKWDKLTCKVIKDLPLELYGEWQVEDYEPPVASGGKVLNEYGNVELFKPTMLPKGCVHIPIGGLNRLAQKLNIDCAPAMVGFDFHSGWTHPVYDGYVVCEEFKDILMDAWNQEQIEQAKRAEEKRQKRIYDNWKKLIQGMLVKERVREMYGNVAPSDEEEDQKETETAKKTSEAKEKDTPRRKIKQEDIDAVRPPLITHQVRNLNIDLSSNVVEMAKKSRKRTMKTKNSIKRVVSKKGKTENTTGKDVKTEQVEEDNEESESDVEEKKAKIRAILQWGNKTVTANPDLSDDSDEERQSRPSSSHVGVPFSDPFYTVGEKQGQVKNKSGKGRKKSQAQEPSDCEEHVTSRSTSRSTTPEPDLGKAGCRRLSRRSAKQKIKTYKESDGENEGYISIDESDCEDKTYNPLKEKKAATHVLNLSEESNSD